MADRLLEATSLDALARLLSEDLPAALGIERATVLLWNRRLDTFETLTPGETRLAVLRPEKPTEMPEAAFLLSDGILLETPGGRGGGSGVLVPLLARTGLTGMVVLAARAGRRKAPFRPTEVRLLSVVATRAALAVENHIYQRELVASERMAVLGTMAGMLAHDFRNPMTVIRGYAELLTSGLSPPETVRRYAEAILRMIDRLDRMTLETLDFARSGAVVARRTVILRPLLDELVTELERELPGLDVVRLFEVAEDATGALDPDKLRRAVANVAANARDAMKGKGRFHVSARLEAATADEGRRLVLVLEDEGPGVPSEIRDTLFEPFVSRGKKAGTGLGLAVARRFVEDHGGTVELLRDAPAPGGPSGARFRLVVPLDAPSASGGAPTTG